MLARPNPALVLLLTLALAPACGHDAPGALARDLTVVTFNTGTTRGLPHDALPDDGYTSVDASLSDAYYGDGLAWMPAVAATRAFLDDLRPDLIAFQEVFDPAGCADIPEEARRGFVCEGWRPGDPTVVERVLGPGYQVACDPGHTDKCAAVRRGFGRFRGCDGAYCPDGLDGVALAGCGSGARVGRGIVEIAGGGSLTLVTVHGTSGISREDLSCRVRQVEQIFVDLGDGAPGASGARNIVLGDLNTDPGRLSALDPSAARWLDFVGRPGDEGGDARPFRFLTDAGRDAVPTYAGLVNVDHVISDAATGRCWSAGLAPEHPPVLEAVYFDHLPAVCEITFRAG